MGDNALLQMLRAVVLITLALAAVAPTTVAAGPAVSTGAAEGGTRPLVAVVRTPDADGGCQELATRIVAELMAEGTPVVELTCVAADAACTAVVGTRVAAVVLVELRGNVRAVEVRAGDAALAVPGRRTPPLAPETARIQRVADSDAGAPPSALAVRTVELLRAMLFDVADHGAARASTPAVARSLDVETTAVRATAASAPAPAGASVPMGPNNVIMAVGAAMIGGFSGLNTAYGPILSIGRRTSDHVVVSAVLAGPSFGRDQSNAAGTVAIRHELAALQADLTGAAWRWLVVRAGVGGGVYHLHIDGQPHPGFGDLPTSRSTGGFAGLLIWSLGVVANLRPDIGLFVDGRMFVLSPTPAVVLHGLEVGRAGNPGITISSGIELRL